MCLKKPAYICTTLHIHHFENMNSSFTSKSQGFFASIALVIVLLTSLFALQSCNNELPEVSNSISNNSAISTSSIVIINGRLRFANQEVFEKIRTELSKAKTANLIGQWEKTLSFNSLRKKSISEPESEAAALLNFFHFPLFYAAMMNEEGEYQIGDDIFWYNQGFRYHASSESELLIIKKKPGNSKDRTQAGAYRKDSLAVKDGNSANRTQDSGDPADARYQYSFPGGYSTFPGSYLKFIYETYVYTEYNQLCGNQPGTGCDFYTTLFLNIRLQESIPGFSDWHLSGVSRYVTYNLDLYANVQHEKGWINSEPRVDINNHVEQTVPLYTYQTLQVILGAGVCPINDLGFNRYRFNRVKWNYDLLGTIDAKLVDTSVPNSEYMVTSNGTGTTLWP